MYAIRQIIEDPQDVIPVPPEFRHRLTEVIFLALDQECDEQALSETRADMAAGRFIQESAEAHLKRLDTL